jgi:exonuclease III
MSTCCPKQTRKVAAILALQTTIIFLSDLRLNTDTLGYTNLFSPRYEMYHNSKDNKRGVGILISSNLQYTVNQEYTAQTPMIRNFFLVLIEFLSIIGTFPSSVLETGIRPTAQTLARATLIYRMRKKVVLFKT